MAICNAHPNWWMVLAHNTLVFLAIISDSPDVASFAEEVDNEIFWFKQHYPDVARLAHLPKDRLAHLVQRAWAERERRIKNLRPRKERPTNRPR